MIQTVAKILNLTENPKCEYAVQIVVPQSVCTPPAPTAPTRATASPTRSPTSNVTVAPTSNTTAAPTTVAPTSNTTAAPKVNKNKKR